MDGIFEYIFPEDMAGNLLKAISNKTRTQLTKGNIRME